MGGASHRLVKHLIVVREPEAAVAGAHVVALSPHDVAAEPLSTTILFSIVHLVTVLTVTVAMTPREGIWVTSVVMVIRMVRLPFIHVNHVRLVGR